MVFRFSDEPKSVVTAQYLLAHPNKNRLFIDTRLGVPEDEYRSFREQHIFGAAHAQIREVFASAPTKDSGNLPLPDVKVLEQRLHNWGVNSQTEIIVYAPSLALAARGWWTLRWAGVEKVQVLDGGLREWVLEGGAVAQGDTPARPRSEGKLIELTAGNLPQIDVNELVRRNNSLTLIDARDDVAFGQGHLPGAINVPAADQWNPSGKLRTIAEVEEVYRQRGIAGDVVVYCGGGVLSALSFLILDSLGMHPTLYVGSWSEWAKDPQRISLSLQSIQEQA